MNGTDMRTHARLSLDASVSVKVVAEQESDPIELAARNIGSGGAFLQTDRPFSIGTPVTVGILLPAGRIWRTGNSRTLVEVTGTVVRADEKGMAVCFERRSGMAA